MGRVPDPCGLPRRAGGGAVRARRPARGLPGDAVGGQRDAGTGGPAGPCPTRPGHRPWRGPAAFAGPTARLVRNAHAGVVVSADGSAEPLPGLDGHPVLAAGSPALAAACAQLTAGGVHRSFLWPVGGRHAPGGHVRITALAPPAELPVHLAGVVLVSPADDLNGLTPRELEVLGLLVDGRSNREIACALVVAQRTVAAHIEHILVKLVTPTRTLAAVRAERAGLYVPCVPRLAGGEEQ